MRFDKDPHEWNGVAPWFWKRIALVLPRPKKRPFLKTRRKGGRPRADDRLALSAIFWRLRTGGTWAGLPKRFGSAATARRRLARWSRGDLLERAWRTYIQQLSRIELERWRAALATSSFGAKRFWRYHLDRVWENEFAALWPSEPHGDGLA